MCVCVRGNRVALRVATRKFSTRDEGKRSIYLIFGPRGRERERKGDRYTVGKWYRAGRRQIKRRWSNPRRDYFECSAATTENSSDLVSASSVNRCRTRLRWAPVGPHSPAQPLPDCWRMRSPRPRSAAVTFAESSCWEHAILRDSQEKWDLLADVANKHFAMKSNREVRHQKVFH